MQVVFSTRSFSSRFVHVSNFHLNRFQPCLQLLQCLLWLNLRYYINQNLKKAFEVAPADPTVDLNMQL